MKARGSTFGSPATITLAIIAAFAVVTAPAQAAMLVVTDDVVACLRAVDLEEAESRHNAQDKAAASSYFDGAQPACMVLKQGESVHLLDRAGDHVQVVTDHGTPRFIGWGRQRNFAAKP